MIAYKVTDSRDCLKSRFCTKMLIFRTIYIGEINVFVLTVISSVTAFLYCCV